MEVAKSHTCDNLAAAFAKIMDKFRISENVIINPKIHIYIYIEFTHQILGVTCDNASNNYCFKVQSGLVFYAFFGKTGTEPVLGCSRIMKKPDRTA